MLVRGNNRFGGHREMQTNPELGGVEGTAGDQFEELEDAPLSAMGPTTEWFAAGEFEWPWESDATFPLPEAGPASPRTSSKRSARNSR
jgi:hypothetical protein